MYMRKQKIFELWHFKLSSVFSSNPDEAEPRTPRIMSDTGDWRSVLGAVLQRDWPGFT